MSDLLLAKPILPSGYIDTSVGEPHVVREILIDTFKLFPYDLPSVPHMFEYPDPQGYKPLVQFLENKHKAPVVITNGAKQALGAIFYTIKQMGKNDIAMKLPYWALLPPLANMHGLNSLFQEPDSNNNIPYLLLAPNNPDGQCDAPDKLKELALSYKEKNVPLIHDAAYYTHTYLPETHTLPPIGDVQIFSISKMLGLSSLRLGYCVCHNKEYYKYIQQYMEAMTVGVSVIPQIFLYSLFQRMNAYPSLSQTFEGTAFNAIKKSKLLFKSVNPDILEIPNNLENIDGMFGWFKVGPKANFDKSKINIAPGKFFGNENFVRMNLAFNEETIKNIISKLNLE